MPVLAASKWFVDAEIVPLMASVRSVAAAVLRLDRAHPDVEDCASETMRRAVEARSRVRPGEPVRPWVLGIARHVALDMARHRRRAGLVDEPAADQDEDRPALVERVPDPAAGPEELLQRARDRAELRRGMARLPKSMGIALLRFHMDGKGYQEIAKELGVPLGTVATWVTRGRKALAEQLGARGRFE